MSSTFLLSLDEAEFRVFLKDALMEVLREVKENAGHDTPDILSISEAANFLKLRVSTLYEKTAEKLIPHFKKGNRLYFHRKELEEWLREGKVKTRRELQTEAATYTMKHS
jgi:excisionase family DNA binding protein